MGLRASPSTKMLMPVSFLMISGFVNLSSQVIYQKWSSNYLGDLYTAYLYLYFIFIIGMVIGGILSRYVYNKLFVLELVSGLWALMVGGLSSLSINSQWRFLAPVILVVPAVITGAFLPAYYKWLKSMEKLYVFTHVGACLGILLIEVLFFYYLKLHQLFYLIGSIQILFGFGLYYFFRQKELGLESFEFTWIRPRKSLVFIFVCSVINVVYVNWSLKNFIVFTEGWRINLSIHLSAVFFIYFIAGCFYSKIKRRLSFFILFLSLFTSIAVIYSTLSYPVTLLHQWGLTLWSYSILGFGFVSYLLIPLIFTSWIFMLVVDDLSIEYAPENAYLNVSLFSVFSQIVGGVILFFVIHYFWSFKLLVFFALCFLLSLLLVPGRRPYKILALILAVLFISGNVNDEERNKKIFKVSYPFLEGEYFVLKDIQMYTSFFSNVFLFHSTFNDRYISDGKSLENFTHYTVDGHFSHVMDHDTEIVVGMMGGLFKEEGKKYKQSFSVGIGSGQSIFGLSRISENLMAVDISDVAMKNLNKLKAYNRGVAELPHVKLVLNDAFYEVDQCKAQSIDLFFNTGTYIANFNASKLYSDEMIKKVKRCMTKDGIYQTYYDFDTVQTTEELLSFLSHLKKYFKHMTIIRHPYPIVFASDAPLELFKHSELRDQVKINPMIRTMPCFSMYADIDFKLREVSTLDNPILERIGLANMIKERFRKEGKVASKFAGIYPKEWKKTCWAP